MFYGSSPVIHIDGYSMPHDPYSKSTNNCCQRGVERFSLGILSEETAKIVVTNFTSENVRKHIGKGITLTSINGNVFLEVLSEYPVFVRSMLLNIEQNFSFTTVCKIVPGGGLKLFDGRLFHQVLSKAANQGFDQVYDLISYCKIVVSFVKGWGADYSRYSVTSTPCWLEIQLNNPLRWLDNVLCSMGCANTLISSRS
ncbi:hypothetical protein GJ496_002114 [Pomphorhynchus laevis]|nr:hypothetical protein GJ496_002109 [Pomphorhynchus laevis]KAI0988060.1 hypothetical protein GJ496_002114 [Pomphorhynchus laevis]